MFGGRRLVQSRRVSRPAGANRNGCCVPPCLSAESLLYSLICVLLQKQGRHKQRIAHTSAGKTLAKIGRERGARGLSRTWAQLRCRRRAHKSPSRVQEDTQGGA
jgi:hypothetical protein